MACRLRAFAGRAVRYPLRLQPGRRIFDVIAQTSREKDDTLVVTELTGAQISLLRQGLQKAFPDSARFDVFLVEKLERCLAHYAGPTDPVPTAYSRTIQAAIAEGWVTRLITEARRQFDHNIELAKLASQLQQGLTPTPDEEKAAQAANLLWKEFNPYRGLEALQEHDADFLFGRNDNIDRFIEAIANKQSKILLALGASGVGKSSLILAGVFGALNRRALKSGKAWPPVLETSHKWPHLMLTPGTEPVRSLAGAFVRQWLHPTDAAFRAKTNEWRNLLLGGDDLGGLIDAADQVHRDKRETPPQRHLIYVDQGEELYTRGGREPALDGTEKETPQQKEARRFSELLTEAAAHPRLIVLMSARSDFLGKLQEDVRRKAEQPAKIFNLHHQLNVSPLTEEGLADVVRRPAAMLGVSFHNALDDTLIAATRGEPGGLPLLSYTLESLWAEMQKRNQGNGKHGAVLRWLQPAPRGIDIAQKLGERADAFLAAHRDQEQVIRRLFCVRLAYVPAAGEPTRQTALIDDLSDEERALVDKLAGQEQRILVTGEQNGRATVSVAHEALFRAWKTLSNWIESRRSFYAWATQIAADRREWEKAGRSPEHCCWGARWSAGAIIWSITVRMSRPRTRRSSLPASRPTTGAETRRRNVNVSCGSCNPVFSPSIPTRQRIAAMPEPACCWRWRRCPRRGASW